jgi:acetate kinase
MAASRGKRILSINCGSSSLKHALFEVGGDAGGGEETEARNQDRQHAYGSVGTVGAGGPERQLARGSVERIGTEVPDHATAVRQVLDALEKDGQRPDAVGHRIVHGGPDLSAPARVTESVLASLRSLVPFAPLHLPPEIRVIEAVSERWPSMVQVACFDTAFHRTLSEVARRYALPDEEARAGLQRYGFHGLSYEFVVGELGAKTLGRAVIAHLGSGASMAAVRDGRSIDTTMGFSPAGGLVMGTRLGDVDPGLIVHWLEEGRGRDAKALDELVNKRSGLLGVSGTTADVRDLLFRRDSDPRAALALDVFTWNARKWVGAMTASLGGIDTLVFTGGIGEHSSPMRLEIARGLEHLGVRIDQGRNVRAEAVVSADGAPCTVRIVNTDEERMVARHTGRVAAAT